METEKNPKLQARPEGLREYPKERYLVKNNAPGPRLLNTVSASGHPEQHYLGVGEEAVVRLQKNPDELSDNKKAGMIFQLYKDKDGSDGEAAKAAKEHEAEVEKTRARDAEARGAAPARKEKPAPAPSGSDTKNKK